MKNNHKGFIIPLLLILITIVAIGGGTYVYFKDRPVDTVVDTSIHATSTTATTSKDPSIIWNVYKNSEYGFEVSYPSDWIVVPNPNNSTARNAPFYFSPQGKYYFNGEISDAKWVVDVFQKGDTHYLRPGVKQFFSDDKEFDVYDEGLESTRFNAFLTSFKVIQLHAQINTSWKSGDLYLGTNNIITYIKSKNTGIPILLPKSLPPSISSKSFVSVYTESGWYNVSFSEIEECHGANACSYGTFSALKLTSKIEPTITDRSIKLAHNITGYYEERTCGGSCTPANLTWIYKGVSYSIDDHFGSYETLVSLANEAILNASE